MKLNYKEFFDKFFKATNEKGLDLSNLKCDHVAYRASSKSEYEMRLKDFENFGKMVHEALVNDRRVSIFELLTPIKYETYRIPALELIEPMEGQIVESGLEHAEFVIDSFQNLLSKYPDLEWNTKEIDRKEFPHLKLQLGNMQVKFHPKGILEMVKK